MKYKTFEVKVGNKEPIIITIDEDVPRKAGVSAPQEAVLQALYKLGISTDCTVIVDKNNPQVTVSLADRKDAAVRGYRLDFNSKEYSVTLIGKWTHTIKLETGLGANINTAKLAATRALQDDSFYKDKKFNLVTDKEKPDLYVMLKNGQKASRSCYRIEMKSMVGMTTVTDSNTKKAVKMSMIEDFKALAKKERDRYASEVERQCGNDAEKLLEWNDSYSSTGRGLKRVIKGGATAKECAKAWFDKQSTGFQEMIAQAQVFSDEFNDVDVTDRKAVLSALNSHPCVVLAKKQGGGITGYICTTNLQLHSAIYEPNMWAKYKLTDAYTALFAVDERRVANFRKALERPEKEQKERAEQISVASCSLRLKERKKGGFEVSTTTYSFVFDNIIAMKEYVGVSPISQTITADIAEKIMTNGYNSVKESFNIEPLALQCAIATLKNNSIPSNIRDVVIKNAVENGVTEENAAFYFDNKINGVKNTVDYILAKNTKGTLL